MAISRRTFLATGAASGAMLRGQSSRRPNVVFLFTDDQRFDAVAALGNRQLQTPNMDRLAANGTAFTHACIMGGTMGAVCVPSRAMMLTGKGLFRAHASMIAPNERSPEPFVMYPELLRDAGYTTFGTGKWHNPPKLFNRCFQDGDNIFFGGMSDQSQTPVSSYDPSAAYRPAERRPKGKFSSELFSDTAVRFLQNYRGTDPFLLYVAYTSPHDPRTAPERFARMYEPERVELPPNFMPQHPFDNGEMKVRDEMLAPHPRTPDEIRRHIAGYYAMVSEVDAQIGRVLKALEDSGRMQDTIIVFAGDNGLAVGQHGLLGKQNLYDHSIRVPLIVSGPGVPRGRRDNGLTLLVDVCPTLLDYAGIPKPAPVEGMSLRPRIEGKQKSGRPSIIAAYRNVQRALRTDRHKLIEYNVGGQRTTQLFDLQKDPWEMRNLADSKPHSALVAKLRDELRTSMRREADPLDLDKPDWGVQERAKA